MSIVEPSSLVRTCFLFCLLGIFLVADTQADDWLRFRGPNGSGISSDNEKIPTSFSTNENLAWTTELPGPGSSSPIIVGDKVFLTCWTGYGTGGADQDQKDLKRHLLCISRTDGKIVWDKALPAKLPEDQYRGMFAENGYTTHTPVSDGERVYVFYGKSGVHAYDLDGKKLWSADVGSGRDPKGWGSSSSPILFENKLIIIAAPEDQKMVAFDKLTGKQIWSTPSTMLDGTWGTPLVVETKDGRKDLVLAVPNEIWGINPDNGKLRWFGDSVESSSMCTSAIVHEGKVFVVGGRNGGAVAINADGEKGSKAERAWSANERSRIGTPVLQDGKIYWINSGIAKCIDAETGKNIYQERLKAPSRSTNAPPAGQGRSGRRRGGGSDYSSPVVANGNMFFVTRSGTVYVVELGKEFKQVATNLLTDGGDFSATPAISNGQMFIRSSKNLYCISQQETEAK